MIGSIWICVQKERINGQMEGKMMGFSLVEGAGLTAHVGV